jgi:hypothetical protein
MIPLMIEAATTYDRIQATLPKIEYHIYELDEQYQEHIVPWILQGVILGLEAIAQACIWFWKASVWAIVIGQQTGQWYVNWMADYCNPFPLEMPEWDPVLVDPWFEELPMFHTPAVFGAVWNPPVRDVHYEIEQLLCLQTVPLMLPPAKRGKKRRR